MHCIDFEISGGGKIILETRGNHWLRICVRHLRKNYANEIESKGVQFPGRGAPDKIKRGG